MSKKVSPIPRGYRTATTCLTVFDVDAAVGFYQAAFGAELLTRQTGSNEQVSMHSTIKVGNSIIAVNQQVPEQGLLSPLQLGGSGGQIHLFVEDVDAYWGRAVEAGAIVRTPIYNAYWGDRTGTLADGNGHLWSIATRLENLSQDQVAKRGKVLRDKALREAGLSPDLSAPVAFAEAPLPVPTL